MENDSENDIDIEPQRYIQRKKKYLVASSQIKLQIARESANTTIKDTINNHPRLDLSYSSVARWTALYRSAKRRAGEYNIHILILKCNIIINKCIFNIYEYFIHKEGAEPTKLPLLGEYDKKVKEAVKQIRAAGGVVNGTVLAGLIIGVLTAEAPWMLKANGGAVDPYSKTLHQSMFARWGFAKRRGTSSRKNMPETEVNEKKNKFVAEVKQKVDDNHIPDALIINWDETSVDCIPQNNYTMDVRGVGTVKIVGKGDKRNVSGVFAAARDGSKLPAQIIYEGKTKRCEAPGHLFPANWDINHSKKHWSTTQTKNDLVDRIIVSYVKETRERLNKTAEQKALVIYDQHATNTKNTTFYQTLSNNNILYQLIPSGMTDECQPMDQLYNKKK